MATLPVAPAAKGQPPKPAIVDVTVDRTTDTVTVRATVPNPDDATTAGLIRHDGGYWIGDLAFGFGENLNKSYFRSFKLKIYGEVEAPFAK